MKPKLTKILSLLLAVVTLFGILPTSAFAACSHSYTKSYVIENENMHSFSSKCTKCGATPTGGSYSGWENHTRNSSGKCTKCGHCNHSGAKTTYSYENSNMHSFATTCSCGKSLLGGSYSGWENHSMSGNSCTKCTYTKSCSHSSNTTVYTDYSSTQHKKASKCNSCGTVYNTTTVSHSWSYGSWSSASSSTHSRTKSCVCGRSSNESKSHSFSGNKCSTCGYTKTTTPPTTTPTTPSEPSTPSSPHCFWPPP